MNAVTAINNSLDRLIDISSNSGLFDSDLSDLGDKDCKKIITPKLLKQTHQIFQMMDDYQYMTEYILHFIPDISCVYLDVDFDYDPPLMTYSGPDLKKRDVDMVRGLNKEKDKLGKILTDRLVKNKILFIYMGHYSDSKGHAMFATIQMFEKDKIKLYCHIYDPHGKIKDNMKDTLVYLTKLIVFTLKFTKKYNKPVTYSIDTDKLKMHNVKGIQGYSNDEYGYCRAFTIMVMSLVYMIHTKLNAQLPIRTWADKLEDKLKGYTPCQLTLLVIGFIIVVTQQISYNVNIRLEKRASKKIKHKKLEDEWKLLDDFYDKLEIELKKEKPRFNSLIHYAITELKFNHDDWKEAISTVKERLKIGKKRL